MGAQRRALLALLLRLRSPGGFREPTNQKHSNFQFFCSLSARRVGKASLGCPPGVPSREPRVPRHVSSAAVGPQHCLWGRILPRTQQFCKFMCCPPRAPASLIWCKSFLRKRHFTDEDVSEQDLNKESTLLMIEAVYLERNYVSGDAKHFWYLNK